MTSRRERSHRLPPDHYVGRKVTAFTACLRDRRPGLAEPLLVGVMIGHLEEAATRYGCTVPLYCFMPDHLHVLLLGETEESNGKGAMDRFKTSSGWWLYRNRPELHWQKDYWDHIVRSREGWEAQARYAAANPVREGLVEDPFDWPYTGSIGYDPKDIILEAHW